MKRGRILIGYTVDDAAVYAPVTLADDEEICRQCEGRGRLDFMASYGGFERRESCSCPGCDGEGRVCA